MLFPESPQPLPSFPNHRIRCNLLEGRKYLLTYRKISILVDIYKVCAELGLDVINHGFLIKILHSSKFFYHPSRDIIRRLCRRHFCSLLDKVSPPEMGKLHFHFCFQQTRLYECSAQELLSQSSLDHQTSVEQYRPISMLLPFFIPPQKTD